MRFILALLIEVLSAAEVALQPFSHRFTSAALLSVKALQSTV
jgi:hypothetical protein